MAHWVSEQHQSNRWRLMYQLLAFVLAVGLQTKPLSMLCAVQKTGVFLHVGRFFFLFPGQTSKSMAIKMAMVSGLDRGVAIVTGLDGGPSRRTGFGLALKPT